jgi:hypothetical protein
MNIVQCRVIAYSSGDSEIREYGSIKYETPLFHIGWCVKAVKAPQTTFVMNTHDAVSVPAQGTHLLTTRVNYFFSFLPPHKVVGRYENDIFAIVKSWLIQAVTYKNIPVAISGNVRYS